MPLPPWTPEISTLDLLVSVAELGSVGRAAQAHGISQPSASSRLSRLERELDVALLVRSPRGTALTPAGEAVVSWARTVVDAAAGLTDGVATLRRNQNARLRVAASLTVAEYLMPEWLLVMRRVHPDIDIAITVQNSSDVCGGVRAGNADIGFIESPDAPANLNTQPVGSDRLALAVAPQYPLAARATRGISPRDLPDLTLLLREPGSGTRDTFLHALSSALGDDDMRLAHAIDLGSTATIVATARVGGGVAVASARAIAADLANGRLVEIPVRELDMTRPLRAVWRGRWPSPPAQELIKLARGRSHR
jgi:DNA-binding transcriptional LysR family regulator